MRSPASHSRLTRGVVHVVKLGGSLATSPELARWLSVVTESGAGRAVLVPGGGPFADAVRVAQRRQQFDDTSAHRMALLAMEQYGLMLTGMQSALVAADSSAAIARILASGGVPVWMPCTMVLACPEIPSTWDVSSDSLAAWLAAQLGAALLVLVKSVSVGSAESRVAADELAERGWVDPLFSAYAAAAGCAIRLLGSDDHARLRRMLVSGVPEGLEVAVATTPAAGD